MKHSGKGYHTVAALVVGLVIVSCLAVARGADTKPTSRPNFVCFLIDDLGYGDVGFNGCTDMRTPQIDKLAAAGAVLEAHYTQSFCSPTRACLLTGRYPTRTGIYRIVMQPPDGGLPTTERTLADSLRALGYQTAICGKWHLGEFDPKYLPLARGFDRQYGHYSASINYFTHLAGLQLNWFRNGKPVEEEGYATDLLAAEACDIVANRDPAKPLFLYVPFNAVHAPLHVPPHYTAPFTNLKGPRRALAGMQAALDKAIGQIVAAVEAAGIRDNTLIVFSSDNGGIWPGTNGPLRDFKGSLYEGGIRTCAFATWPGRIPAGQRIKQPMHVVDWYPTFVKLAGGTLDQTQPLDGRDVWPMLTQSAPSPHEQILIAALPDDAALRVGDWKLTHARRSKKMELYNVAEDIGETKDLAAAEPVRFQHMRARLAKALAGAVPPFAEPAPSSAAASQKRPR
jgi:arylsulfatase A-like enzyme